MKRLLTFLFAGLAMVVMVSGTVWAQATAQINGTVKDQTGAVLPGAEVTVTQTDTGITREALSDETGSYVLPNLPLGPYKVEVGLPGFKTYVQTGIALGANANPVINAVLEVGQVSEQVEVQANATQVETRSLSVRQVIETQDILELPLNGRNATDLITLAGGAVATGNTSSSRALPGGVGISVGGLQGTSVAYTLDGALHNNPYDNLNLPIPFPDALQEFSVQTGAQNAAQGFLSGAQVGAVTKSGTNSIHGDAFDFMRNDVFKAHDYFSLVKGTQRRNQFGGTVGGPIVQNKLFFFAGFQGTMNRANPADQLTIVPTPRMLAGDFSEIVKVYTDPINQTGGCRTAAINGTGAGATPGLLKGGFVNNQISPSLYSKAALNLVARLPKPENECGEVHWGRKTQSGDAQILGKIDYQKSPNNSIFGRIMFAPTRRTSPYKFTPDNLLSVSLGGNNNLGTFVTLGDTYLISPNTVNSVRLAMNRTDIHRLSPGFFSIEDLGVKAFSYLKDHTLLSVNGSFSLGGGTESEATYRTTAFQLTEDLNMVRGTHQSAIGVNLAEWRSNTYANVRSPGVYSFTADQTGLGMADFLLGRLNSVRQAAPNPLLISQWYLGLYAQDAWRISPRLTVNAGLRWEPYFPQQVRDSHSYNFNYDRMLAGVRTTQYTKAPPGLYYPGDPGFPSKAGINKNWKAFGPRVGLGWDVNGDGKTSVRASYGISYDFANVQLLINSVIAPPFANDLTYSGGTFDDPWANYPGGNPFPYAFGKDAPFGQFGVFVSIPYDIKTTSVQAWNLALQRQMPANIFLSVQYSGSGSRHLWFTYPLNPAIYFPGSNCTLPNGRRITGTCSTTGASNVNERRLLSLINYDTVGQYYGALDTFDDGGTSNYHGVTVSVSRRATRNLNISGNYTWSHCIGGANQAGGTANVNAGSVFFTVLNNRAFPADREADYANCGSDRRQTLHTTAVVQTPRFENKILRWLGTGWRVSNIYGVSSGSYFDVAAGADRALIGGNTGAQRAIQLLSDPLNPNRDRRPRTSYLNLAAFAQPDLGTLAPNKGQNNILNPWTWQWDAAVSRAFQIREGQSIEFRVEAYNVPNSYRPGSIDNTITSSTYGQAPSSGNSVLATRDMQFALKYIF